MNKDIANQAVLIASKLFHFGDGILVEFKTSEFFPNAEVTSCARRDYSIWFNIDLLNKMDNLELCCTAFHEVRHIYQFVVLDFEEKDGFHFNVSQERKEQWRLETSDYKVSDKFEDEEYLNQDIEIDAIAFAHYLMKKLFDATTIIPKVIKPQVLKRVKEIEEEFDDKLQCL